MGEWYMRETMTTILRSRAFKIAALSIIAGGITISSVSAVFIVHDPKNGAQIINQIKKATEQVASLKRQIDLQLENLQSLKAETIDPILQEVALVNKSYQDFMNTTNDVIKGGTSARDALKNVCTDYKNLNLNNITYAGINGQMNINRENAKELNIQIGEAISQNQERLAKSQERIKKLTEQIAHTHGEKDLAQLQALLQSEEINSQNIANEISALQAKQELIKSQVESLEKEAASTLMKKTANDFDTFSEQLLRNKPVEVKSNNQHFRDRAYQKGWQ